MVRVLWFVPPALLVITGLFLFMAKLVDPDARYQTRDSATLDLSLTRMRFDSDIQLRERALPPPPEPEIEPPKEQVIEQPKFTPPPMPDIQPPSVSLDNQLRFDIAKPVLPKLLAPKNVTPEVQPTQIKASPEFELGQVPKHRVNPQYPRRAKQRKIQGYIIAEFRVDEAGEVIADSLNLVEAKPKGIFEKSVRRAVLRWRYNPLIRDGKAVAYKTRQRFEFNLKK